MVDAIKLLIVEDNPDDAELAEFALKSAGVSLVSRVVEDEEEYRTALKAFSPDIILSDYDLPLFNGALALKIAREESPKVPFILFTGALGEERAIEILTGGATDYVMKNRLSRLVPAVERALKESAEHKQRKDAEAERDQLLQQLEARVQMRTAQLQEEIETRRQIELELRESEANYRALFEATEKEKNYVKAMLQALPAGMAIVDAYGRVVMANPEYDKVWGRPRQAARGIADDVGYEAWWDDGRPVEPQEWASSLALATGDPVLGQQMEIRRFDGSRAFILNSAVPVRDGFGRITGAVVAIMEITERRKTEELLHWNQKRQEHLADIAGRLLTSEDPQLIANDLFRKTMAFLDCDVYFNYLVDDRLGCLHLNAYGGIPAEEAEKIELLDYGVAVCGCAARDAVRLVMEDIPSTPDIRTDLVRSYGVQAYACHPLLIEGRVLGTISFGTRSRTRFAERELEVMRTVADFVAIAMHRLITNNALKESEARYKDLFEKMSRQVFSTSGLSGPNQ